MKISVKVQFVLRKSRKIILKNVRFVEIRRSSKNTKKNGEKFVEFFNGNATSLNAKFPI